MNEKNEIKKPDSLIVASAQSELWRTISKYSTVSLGTDSKVTLS